MTAIENRRTAALHFARAMVRVMDFGGAEQQFCERQVVEFGDLGACPVGA